MKIIAHKYCSNPILTPVINENSFERGAVYNPAAIVKNNKVYLFYRAEEVYYKEYISRIGLAVSSDGFIFERYDGNPVMVEDKTNPSEKYGCEDPRIVETGENNYFLTYNSYAGGSNVYLCGAYTSDLIHFQKTGKLITANGKSGGIIQNYKYKDSYVMYYGEGDIRIAYSRDLKIWDVQKKPVLVARENYFDSFLVEPGPPPIIYEDKILMIYNSAKKIKRFGGGYTWASYSPGFAIFDKENPEKLLERSNNPFIEPSEYWENYGKVNYVIFATGLVFFRNKWLLYYGGADKSIGVARLEFH